MDGTAAPPGATIRTHGSRTHELHCGPAYLVVGLALDVVGVATLLLATGGWAKTSAGVVALVGGALTYVGATDFAHARRLRRRIEAGEAAPWFHHHDWAAKGEFRRRSMDAPRPFGPRLRGALWTAAAVGLCATLLSAASLRRPPDQALLLLGVAAAVTAFVLARRGRAVGRVGYREFPYRVGRRVVLDFRFDGPRAAEFDTLMFTLQCMTETPRWRGLRRPRVRRVFATSVERGGDLPPGSFEIEVEFDVPRDAPGADPLATPAVYWELAVEGEGAGFHYEDVFLVPVYARAA